MIRWQNVLVLPALLTFTAFGFGCGSSTPCDEAVDKAQQCGLEDAKLNDSGENCEAIAQCEAKCVLAANCGEIRDLDPKMMDCMDSCG